MNGAAGDGQREDETAKLLARGLAAGAWVAPSAESLAEAIPGLRVNALAGRGGMGAVYRAEQTRLGRTVAVKILPNEAMPDALARERFEREARVLSEIDHPHVLRIYDFGVLEDGMRYLVTEWAEGGDLAGLADGRPQPPEKVAEWVDQIAAALDAVHAKGVVHRDLKPANVLVRGSGRLALGDFGLARASGAGFTTTLTLSGVIFGTLDYMAPEQLGPGEPVSPATDVYALGVMTYFLLTGRLPRGAFTKASRLAGVPAAVDTVLEQALANESRQRPGSAGEFARRLRAALGGSGRRGRRAWKAALAGGAAALALAVVIWPETPGREPSEAPRVSSPVPAIPPVATPATVAERPVETVKTEPTAPAAVALEDWASAPLASANEAEARAADAVVAPVVDAVPETPSPSSRPARAEAQTPWTWLLPRVSPGQDATAGGWTLRGGELVTDAGVCTLRLPVTVPADFRYDVAVEFTRTAGRNSVGVFLATSSGAGAFELDAWEQGLGGIQMVDGRDMRTHGETFSAVLRNGERTRMILQVRGTLVEALVDGVSRRSWDLTGRRLENLPLWGAGARGGLGLCSWRSPTTFHRVAYRAAPPSGAE